MYLHNTSTADAFIRPVPLPRRPIGISKKVHEAFDSDTGSGSFSCGLPTPPPSRRPSGPDEKGEKGGVTEDSGGVAGEAGGEVGHGRKIFLGWTA